MAKHQQLVNATGVTWRPHGDGRFIPMFKWKSIMFKGEPRPYKAFHKGERAAVLNFMASRISVYMFGAAPQLFDEDGDGKVHPTDNPEWDALPYLITDPETDLPAMSDGSELPTE
jgi:hypothetical protein